MFLKLIIITLIVASLYALKKGVDACVGDMADPHEHCTYHRNQGCFYIGGPLCNYPDCGIEQDYLNRNIQSEPDKPVRPEPPENRNWN